MARSSPPTHHHVAPSTGESSNAVIGLYPLAALGAPPVAVALHPVVQQISPTFGFLRLHIGGDAGGGGMLHTPLVDRIFANCQG